MPCYHLIKLVKSSKPDKKMMAVFSDCSTKREKTVHFGAKGMSDYTIHRDDARKQRYLARHSKNENWSDPSSAGALSRWVLWNKPSLNASVLDYKRRFKL